MFPAAGNAGGRPQRKGLNDGPGCCNGHPGYRGNGDRAGAAVTQTIADALCWRAELTFGTREGYQGPEVVKPDDLIPHIEAYQQRLDPWYAVIVWTRGTVIGPTFPSETVIKITMESNPLYTANATEQDVADYATHLADYLATEFQQVRVYVALYPIRSLIVDTSV